MPRKKVFITVKTYPTLSKKYDELVCTAGFDEEGDWVRLYPIPFRKIDYGSRYKKYSWIELDVEKNTSDFRRESYRPINIEDIRVIGEVPADGGPWLKRREIVLKNIYSNLSKLIGEAKDNKIGTSLAVFKPSEIIDFVYEPVAREWDKETLEYIEAHARQADLFRNSENPFKLVKKLPYKFSYIFRDDKGVQSKLMIEDWEIGGLYWHCFQRRGNEKSTCIDVRKKYYDDFVKTKDLFFFLGTTKEFHNIAPNPFIIVGVFYPKPIV